MAPASLHFRISKLVIGEWTRDSEYPDSLVAKCSFARKKLIWEIMDREVPDTFDLKKKIEIEWEDVLSIRESTDSDDGSKILDVELRKPPSFYIESNPGGCTTRWKETDQDFTMSQASTCRRHRLHFDPEVLRENKKKLESGDSFWFKLFKIDFPTLPSLYFEQYCENSNNHRLTPNDPEDSKVHLTHGQEDHIEARAADDTLVIDLGLPQSQGSRVGEGNFSMETHTFTSEEVEFFANAHQFLAENNQQYRMVQGIVPEDSKVHLTHGQEDHIEARAADDTVVIDELKIESYVGKPALYEQTPIGVAMGLAKGSVDGLAWYLKTILVEEGEGIGSVNVIGEVGTETYISACTAYKVAQRILLRKQPGNTFFVNSKVHIYMPRASGLSGGCTITTSLLSLAMKKSVRKDLAMTGEITLTGGILDIDHVKEKTLGARRIQVKNIIFPEANRREFDELPEYVKEGLIVHFVDTYEQIFDLAFNYEH